ncbi:MAG: hypothetical protein JXA18_04740 [Chitinispirillaceae bacterium]|nr:hypothetical protein [Chitinispirillaceae bacterium]
MLNNQYDSAIIEIDRRSALQSDPLPAVLKLAVLSLRDVDFEKTVDSALFLRTYESAAAKVGQWETSNGASSYSLMLSGLSKAIHSAFYLRQKKYFAALQNGLDAVKLLREAQQADSSNYEVDLVLGSYEYGRAELRSRYWWILFWYPGDRHTGIKRVERCASKAVLAPEAARFILCDLYLQEKRFEDAKRTVHRLKRKYPGSRFVRWAEAKYFETMKEYRSAAEVYRQLSLSYNGEKWGEYNALYTGSRQAFMLYKAGDEQSANAVCDHLLARSQIGKYKELKREIMKLRERSGASDN